MRSNCLEFFADFFSHKIGRKLHKEHNFWKEKQKSMSHNGTQSNLILHAEADSSEELQEYIDCDDIRTCHTSKQF